MRIVQKLGYALGDFGCNFIFATLLTWFIPFCVSKGLTIEQAGLIVFVSKFIDAAVDFFLGYTIDKKNLKVRKLMLIGAPLVYVSLALLRASNSFITLFTTFTLLNSICYNIVNIPYSTLNLRMTSLPNERVDLNCWRMFGSISCIVLVNFLTPIIGNMHIINGALFLVFTVLCALVCKEKHNAVIQKLELKNIVPALLKRPSFYLVSIIFFIVNCKLTGTFIKFGMAPETAGINTLLFMGPSLLMMFILPKVYEKTNKRLMLLIAFILSAILAVPVLYPSAFIRTLADGFAFSVMASLLYNLYSDVSDDIESSNGLNVQAVLFAVAGVLTNLANGFTALFATHLSAFMATVLSVGAITSFVVYRISK